MDDYWRKPKMDFSNLHANIFERSMRRQKAMLLKCHWMNFQAVQEYLNIKIH